MAEGPMVGTPPQGEERPPLRVLALDGGGIRGAFCAGVLDGLVGRAQQEEDLKANVQHRKPIKVSLLDYVDLITGTSTGGIIAIALAMGKRPDEICSFYREYGPRIFPRDPLGWRSVINLLKTRYSAKPLQRAIESVVGSSPLREAGCALVIPAVSTPLGKIRLFKTAHAPNELSTPDVSAVHAALATAAAPTYFPAHTIPDGFGTFVDGGLWANCPAMVGVTEAVAFLHYGLSDIRMLSISTTSVPFHISRAKRMGGLVLWAKPIIDALMRFQVESARAKAQNLLNRGGGVFYRIDEDAPEGVYTMDNARQVEDLLQIGRETGSSDKNYEVVRNHFLTGKPATLHRRLGAGLPPEHPSVVPSDNSSLAGAGRDRENPVVPL
jgi:uncharacterized protein